MKTLIIANMAFAIIYLSYHVFLRHLTFHRWNRFLLLSMPITALLAALVTIPSPEVIGISVSLPQVDVLSGIGGDGNSQAQSSLFNTVYFIGLTLFLVQFAFQLIRLMLLISRHRFEKLDNLKVAVSDEEIPTFSFFNYVIVGKKDEGNLQTVLKHEKLHTVNMHSLDQLYAAIITALSWFNPTVHLWRKEVALNAEYEVDSMISGDMEFTTYANILSNSQPVLKTMNLASSFNPKSNLFKRLKMMKKAPSTRRSMINYSIIIPALFAGIFIAACQQEIEDLASGEEELITGKAVAELDKMPTFKGGNEAMIDYLINAIKYPKAAKEEGVSGVVHVSFTVASDGEIKDVSVIKEVHPLLDAEALRVVSEMDNWDAGLKNGEAVPVQMILPISFQLNEDQASKNKSHGKTLSIRYLRYFDLPLIA